MPEARAQAKAGRIGLARAAGARRCVVREESLARVAGLKLPKAVKAYASTYFRCAVAACSTAFGSRKA